MSHPNAPTSERIRDGRSSKLTNTPGSPIFAPAARNWVAKMLLPLPEVPVTKVSLPRGKPAVRNDVETLDLGTQPCDFLVDHPHLRCHPRSVRG